MSAPQNIIALVFDFDDTLTDDSTTALLESHKINTTDFWEVKLAALVNAGWDPAPAYLKLILDNVGPKKKLGKLTNARLRKFGARLKMYPGLPGLFKELQQLVSTHKLSNPGIEFYIVSGGLEEVIRGSAIASHVQGIWGCQFDEENNEIRHIRRVVSFTEKTKYLYMINKGITNPSTPYAVNQHISNADRRVPFSNMIYLGDGLTDVPCFSMLTHFGGRAFGVFDPKKKDSPKKAWEQLVAPHRVFTVNAPKYRKSDDLGSLLRAAVESICLAMDARTGSVKT
jgi:phosphoserine phosphatase